MFHSFSHFLVYFFCLFPLLCFKENNLYETFLATAIYIKMVGENWENFFFAAFYIHTHSILILNLIPKTPQTNSNSFFLFNFYHHKFSTYSVNFSFEIYCMKWKSFSFSHWRYFFLWTNRNFIQIKWNMTRHNSLNNCPTTYSFL
jgi:hypothetical protein